MRSLGDRRKTRWLVMFGLILVLLLSLGGFTYAAPPPDARPPEIRITERDTGKPVQINGEVLVVSLESNPATGYGWRPRGLDQRILRQMEKDEWQPASPDMLGAPGAEVLRFAGVGKGRTTLHLDYARPWDKGRAPAKSIAIEVSVIQPSASGSYAEPAADEPLEPPAGELSLLAVPAAYNWCDLGACTPVRDQGNCGSCWAFATVGPVESNILIKDGASKDLAEQWLVSCNTDGYDCGGGWWAHKYFVSPGAVYEQDFPYTATDAPCGGPYSYHEKIASWAYVGTSYSVPSTAAIKQAIADHGPVSAAVCVNTAFRSYTSGVFNPSTSCTTMNHGIVLVGWDDTLGAWRLRNSWGPDWGEDGYMWIAYGKNRVGYAAAYVVYNSSIPPVPPAAPSDLAAAALSYSRIDLAWTDNASNESGFKIERCAGEGCADFAQIATAAANATGYSNTGLAAATSYSYRVRAYNDAGDSAYSNEAAAVTGALPAPPAAPANLAAAALSYDRIDLTWSDSDTETGYRIERCAGEGCAAFAQIATAAANATGYSNTGLAAATSYSYRVLAYNDGGASEYSNTATAVTQAAPAVPAAPTNLVATTVSKSQINLTWTDNAENESGFKIERCKGATCTNFTQIATVAANATAYSNTKLTANTAYRYRVRAYNASGNSAYSNIAAATTLRR